MTPRLAPGNDKHRQPKTGPDPWQPPINVTTGAATAVGPTGFNAGGMAFDALNNTMYASDAGAGGSTGLFTINVISGASTLVGPFNNPSVVEITGLAFDSQLGLFGSDNKQSNAVDDELFAIDTASGQATLIGSLNSGNTLGLTFVIPEPATLTLAFLALLGLLAHCHRRRRA